MSSKRTLFLSDGVTLSAVGQDVVQETIGLVRPLIRHLLESGYQPTEVAVVLMQAVMGEALGTSKESK